MKLPKKRRRVVAVQQPRRNPAQRRRGEDGDIFPRRINAVKHHNNNNSGAAGPHALAGHKFATNGSLQADVEDGRAAPAAVPAARKTSRASLLSGILRQGGHKEAEGEARREAAPCYQQNTPNVHLHSQST